MLNVVIVAYFFLVPESPRWLLATGRIGEAETVFKKIAHWNGVDEQDGFKRDFPMAWKAVARSHADVQRVSLANHIRTTTDQIKAIMASPMARNRFLLSMYPWFASGLAYYGIFLSVKFIQVNQYALVMITAATEIPLLLIMNVVISKVYIF
jgi:OCT family organic cation transporter-like MFS transporter 4/5